MPIKNSQGVNLAQTTLSLAVQNPLYGAPDNAISNGLAYANWSVDAGSTKGATGIVLKRNGGSEFAEINVTGLAANTTYWCRILVVTKSAGANGFLRVMGSPTSGSNFLSLANGDLDLSAAPSGSVYYFQLKTDASTGPNWKLRIQHQTSPNGETIQFQDFRVFPIAARSAAKTAVLGDRAGGFAAAPASATNKALLDTQADTVNIIAMGDQADTTNSHAVCDCLQVASVGTTNLSPNVNGPANAFEHVQVGMGITGTGIPANTTVLTKNSNTSLVLSANATATGTITATFTSVLKVAIAARGGNRYIAIGNHDYDGSRETEVDDYFDAIQTSNNPNKFYYSKVLGECEFFFLNDNDSGSGNAGQELIDNAGGISTTQANYQASTQGQWIVNALAASTAKWKIVCIHHAVYSSSSTGGGWASNRWNWKALGAHVVFQAHNHGVERIFKDGVYFITQAMGGGNHHGWSTKLAETQFRFDSAVLAGFATTWGYFKLSDSATALVIEYFDTSHNLWDRVKITQP